MKITSNRIGFVCLSCLLVLGACVQTTVNKQGENNQHQLTLVYTDWTESVAMTYLVAHLLEKELDYDIVIKMADVDQVFRELGTAGADVFVDVWLPATHKTYMGQYPELEDLGAHYHEAKTGLVVPAYMPVNDIKDLQEHYEGSILGIDSAAGIMQSAKKALASYQLEHELTASSDAEMAERLEEAIKRRQPVVVTGWEPHWLFYRYDVRFLEDPKAVFMERESIHAIGRSGFSEEFPHAAQFFDRMVLTEKQMNSLLYEMKMHSEARQGVKRWIEKNAFIVNQWTKGLGEQRQKIM